MSTQKLSISLSKQQYDFIESYRNDHHYTNRSEVISEAISLLQQAQLEVDYREANQELNQDFNITTGDGITDDETW